jgi:hypothetical protein
MRWICRCVRPLLELVTTKAESLPSSSPSSDADALEISRLGRRDDTCSCLGGRWARLGPRLPQPHQLHRQIASGDRRVQTPTTPSIMKSRISGQAGAEETIGSQHQPRSRLNNRKMSMSEFVCTAELVFCRRVQRTVGSCAVPESSALRSLSARTRVHDGDGVVEWSTVRWSSAAC